MNPGMAQIPAHSGSVSQAEQIFRDYEKRDLAEADYFVMNAAWVSENLNQYQTQFFPEMPEQIAAYVDSRIQNTREYDAETGARLGRWVSVVTEIHESNRHNVQLLNWCVEKLNSVSLGHHTKKIAEMISRLDRTKLPQVMYSRALRCQILDAEARKRKGEV